MERRGIFTFVLVLIFLQGYLVVAGMGNAQQGLELAEGYLAEMEIASSARLWIESSIDFLVEETMRQEITEGNINSTAMEERVSQRLCLLLREIESQYTENPEVKFHTADFSGGSYLRLLERKGEAQDCGKLAEYFSIVVVNAGRNAYDAEFVWTGGESGRKVVYAAIEFPGFRQVFAIPLGYSLRVAGVKIL